MVTEAGPGIFGPVGMEAGPGFSKRPGSKYHLKRGFVPKWLRRQAPGPMEGLEAGPRGERVPGVKNCKLVGDVRGLD